MTSTFKNEFIRKRLTSAGIPSEDVDKYTYILRGFLAARLTKVKFETEMLKVIPREKISAHNSIIRELLYRSQQKRDDVPDLPNVTPIVERPPSRVRERPTPSQAPSRKRQREQRDEDEGRLAGGPSAPVPKPGDNVVAEQPAKPKPEKPKPDPRPRPPGKDGRIGANAPPRPPGTPSLSGVDISTYNTLQFVPVRPGAALDLDLFLRLRQRVKEQAVELMGMSGVKDDAVALMLLATESHVKSLMEAGVRQRSARQALRPKGNVQCGPVRGHDFREAALRNTSILGDDAGLELERLALLLY